MVYALLAVLAFLAVVTVVAIIVVNTRPEQSGRTTAAARPSSGWEYLLIGTLISAGGGAVLAVDGPAWAWAPAGWLGSVLVLIGVIAVGVTVGARRAQSS